MSEMPDHIAPSDSDESLEPHFNEPGEFWDGLFDWLWVPEGEEE
jgi:hypothetical protein